MNFVLNNQQTFPIGTTVKAYPTANWSKSQLPPVGAPVGAAAAEAVVDATGAATLVGLVEGTHYFATAQVGGAYRYVHFVPVSSSVPATRGYVDTAVAAAIAAAVPGTALLGADLAAITAQTVLQKIEGLAFEIGASATEVWRFDELLLVNEPNTEMDLKLGLSGPAGATASWAPISNGVGGSFVAVAAATTAAIIGAIGTEFTMGGVNGTFGIMASGLIFGGGTAGKVIPMYAQATSNAGNLKILKGSMLEARKIRA